ncbi:MAG: nitrite/sulfite reductase, partial [Acidimicrobiales bacterium]
ADGRLGFNVLVGGGLSDGPRMASDIDMFITLGQATETTRGIAQVFGELGNRENRGLSRMRYLVQELGPKKFRAELVARLDFDPEPAGENLTRRYRGDHIGVHPQRQAGLNYVGLNVTVGRIAGKGLAEMGRLAEEYGDGGLRLATDQNLILTGVPDDRVAALLAEPLLEQYSPRPGPFERGVVACTGTEFCRFAIVETKMRAVQWARHMDEYLAHSSSDGAATPPGPSQAGDGSDDIIRMHFSGCSASCAQPQIADIGFRGDTAISQGKISEAVDIGLGGSLGTDAAFIDWVEGAKPTDEVPQSLERLVDAYQAQRRSGERFYQWARRRSNDELRDLVTPSAAGAVQGAR